MKLALVFLLCLSLSLALSPHEQFRSWMATHNKKYANTEEFTRRLANFQNTLKRIDRLSKLNPQAKFDLNKFSDFSEEEFAKFYKMKKVSAAGLATSCLANGVSTTLNYDTSDLPESFDWRSQGAVTPVKDQGQCGSCWTFSTTGNIEGQYFLKTKNLVSLSEQVIVDCSQGCCNIPGFGNVCNQGCNGGWQWNAFYDIVSWGGLETEAQYPYTSGDGNAGTCKKNNALIANISGYNCLSNPKNNGSAADEDQMAAYVQKNGPISIALNADLLQDYSSGILNPWFPGTNCDPTALDHALLIVGWGVEKGIFEDVPFWIVKNSWAESWGENGYFRIKRGGNICGIANAASSSFM